MNLDTDFAGDDGSPDPLVREAIVQFVSKRNAESSVRLIDTLSASRVLVPVVAVVDAVEEGREKDSHMRQVDFTSSDGRRALLAFTGTDSLQAWDRQARPIPRRAFIAAQGVLEADYDALLIDIAGPVPVAIEGPILARVALGVDRDVQLANALDRCCGEISALAGVGSARWSKTDEGIAIIVSLVAAPAHLADEIPELLRDPALSVLLDVPLTVELTGDFAAGHPGGVI